MLGFGKRKKKILFAEDDTNIRNIIQFMLEGKGFEVMAVGDGKAASEALPKFKPDLVMLDVMMPHKNGLEVCYEIKNDPKTLHLPVLILTATTQTSTKTDDYWRVRSRADDFITKPFKSSDLLARIEKLLGEQPDKPEDDAAKRFRI